MDYGYLLYVLLIGIAGSFTAFLKSGEKGIVKFLKRSWDGCFSGAILYELAYHWFQSDRLSFVACGIGAWFGSEIFIYIRNFLANKFGGGYYDNYEDRRF